jgi:TctA family transporter
MPLLMGFVIAAPFEDHLRRAITHARGDWLAVAAQPGVVTVAAGAALVALGAQRFRRTSRSTAS